MEDPATVRSASAIFKNPKDQPVGSAVPCLLLCPPFVNTRAHHQQGLHRLILDLNSGELDSKRHAVMELRLLTKRSPENRLKIAIADPRFPLLRRVSLPLPPLIEAFPLSFRLIPPPATTSPPSLPPLLHAHRCILAARSLFFRDFFSIVASQIRRLIERSIFGYQWLLQPRN